MRYDEAVRYLLSILGHIRASNFGLDRMEKLCARLGNPERQFRVVHIAGTNGKGSTAAMIEAGLRAAGHRTGLYTSPHLMNFNERYAIDGRPIDDAGFARVVERLYRANEAQTAEFGGEMHPTMFETVTAGAFCAFEEAQVDWGVIETGLGGRLDASNVVRPELCVITPIGLDHEAWLGTGLRAIAGEKAGIFKPEARAAVISKQDPEALARLLEGARAVNVPAIEAAMTWSAGGGTADAQGRFLCSFEKEARPRFDVRLNLAGRHQVDNALTAVAALDALGVEDGATLEGLATVEWPGRLEWIGDEMLLDAAHNPSGARMLAAFLERFARTRPVHLIYGSSRDKAVEEVAGWLFPRAQRVTLTRSSVPRSVGPQTLNSMLDHLHDRIGITDSVSEALGEVREGELTVVAGSIFLIGEVRERLLCGSG